MQNALLETSDEYLRTLFHERQCVRLVCLTEEVAVIKIGETPDAKVGRTVDIERSTLNAESWLWLEGMPQSRDETERAFETARVRAERARMRNDFLKAYEASEEYRRHLRARAAGNGQGDAH